MEVGPMKRLLCELSGKNPEDEDIRNLSEDEAIILMAHLSTKEARRAVRENTGETE